MDKFKHDFKDCFICGKEMTRFYHGLELRCDNGCCTFEIDPQGESVFIELFGGEDDNTCFSVRLYERTWHNEDITKRLKENERELMEAVKYWQEDDRYLMRIMSRGDSN